MSAKIDSGHIDFGKAALNYFQQTAHEVAVAMMEDIATARTTARQAVSPQKRRAAREVILQAQGQLAAYNALIAMAGDIANSLEKFEGANLDEIVGEVSGGDAVEETNVIIMPEG